MEFKNLQDFHDAFKDAWWMNGESESDSSTDNEGFADILQFKSLIAALRPDYKNDLLHVIDVLVNFHENGCPGCLILANIKVSAWRMFFVAMWAIMVGFSRVIFHNIQRMYLLVSI